MDKKSLGEVFKALRKEVNITQDQLADGICSRKTIQDIEKGEQVPTIELIFDFSFKMGYDFLSKLSFSRYSEGVLLYHQFEEIKTAYMNRNYEHMNEMTETTLNSYNLLPVQREILIWYRGVYKFVKGDFAACIEILTKALNCNNSEHIIGKLKNYCTEQALRICNTIAVANAALSKFDLAIKIYEKLIWNIEKYGVVIEDSFYIRAHYNLAKCYNTDGKKRFNKAIEVCKKGIKIASEQDTSSHHPDLYIQLGNAYSNLGNENLRNQAYKRFIYYHELNGNHAYVRDIKIKFQSKYGIEFVEDFSDIFGIY